MLLAHSASISPVCSYSLAILIDLASQPCLSATLRQGWAVENFTAMCRIHLVAVEQLATVISWSSLCEPPSLVPRDRHYAIYRQVGQGSTWGHQGCSSSNFTLFSWTESVSLQPPKHHHAPSSAQSSPRLLLRAAHCLAGILPAGDQ